MYSVELFIYEAYTLYSIRGEGLVFSQLLVIFPFFQFLLMRAMPELLQLVHGEIFFRIFCIRHRTSHVQKRPPIFGQDQQIFRICNKLSVCKINAGEFEFTACRYPVVRLPREPAKRRNLALFIATLILVHCQKTSADFVVTDDAIAKLYVGKNLDKQREMAVNLVTYIYKFTSSVNFFNSVQFQNENYVNLCCFLPDTSYFA